MLEQQHPDDADAAVNALVDEYRTRCLWFLRPDWYPQTLEERLRAVSYIERYGDANAFRRAGVLRRWLSRPSREMSAG